MADDVKTRAYNSPRRREQAAATRRAILDAAQVLFERQDYAATSMGAIAAEAGVSVKTVYLAFETKSGVLRALWNLLLRGDEGDAPVAARAWYRAVLDEPDPERQLRMNARNSRRGKARIGALLGVIRRAAPFDADIAALWRRIQDDYLDNQKAIVASVAAKGALRDGLDVDRGADILWTVNHPDVFALLVGERGWTLDHYEAWSAEVSCDQLLAPSRRSSVDGDDRVDDDRDVER